MRQENLESIQMARVSSLRSLLRQVKRRVRMDDADGVRRLLRVLREETGCDYKVNLDTETGSVCLLVGHVVTTNWVTMKALRNYIEEKVGPEAIIKRMNC